jgi:secondary thiamine-phosphate synthase enzyme
LIEFQLQSQARIQTVDITDLVTSREWPDGLLWLSTPHTTVSLVIGEADEDMLADYERVAGKLFEPYQPFRHHKNDNPNAAAHLLSSFGGTQLLLPVVAGRPVLGTHQRIVFIELDGPKARRLKVASIPVIDSQEG